MCSSISVNSSEASTSKTLNKTLKGPIGCNCIKKLERTIHISVTLRISTKFYVMGFFLTISREWIIPQLSHKPAGKKNWNYFWGQSDHVVERLPQITLAQKKARMPTFGIIHKEKGRKERVAFTT